MAVVIVSNTEDNNGAGGDIVLTEPASVATDDILLTFLSNYQTGGGSATPSDISGFTNITSVTNSELLGKSVYRQATGSEGPTYTSTVAEPNEFTVGKMLRLTGAASSPTVEANTSSGLSAAAAMAAVTPSINGTAIAHVIANSAISATPPTGWSLYVRYDSNFQAIFYKAATSGVSTGTDTVSLGGSQDWVVTVVVIETAPAVPEAPTVVRTGSVRDEAVPISWTNPAGTLTGRVVEYAAEPYRGATLSWIEFEDSATTTNSVTVTGLTNGTRYIFRVAMKNADGVGSYGVTDTGATPIKRPWIVGVGTYGVSTSTDVTPSYPAGYTAVEGDYCMIIGEGRPTGTTEIATPADYAVLMTELFEVGAEDLRLQAFGKVLTAAEAQPAIAVPSGWTGATGGMALKTVIIRDADVISVAAVESSSAAAATFRPTGLTTLGINELVINVVATADDNVLILDVTTSPNNHQNFDLVATDLTTTGGDMALGIASRWGAIPALSTQAGASNALTASFQDDLTPTDTGDYQFWHNGTGGRVFIIDSGVRGTHDEFGTAGNRITDTWVPSGSGWTATDDARATDGHGTLVASIAAGDTLGIARGADIIILKISNTSGSETPSAARFTEALEWIVANYDPPYFVNWSLAGPAVADASEYADYMTAMDVFAAAGGVLLTAGGNDGGEIGSWAPDDHVAAYRVMGHGALTGAKHASSSVSFDQMLSASYDGHVMASKTSNSATVSGGATSEAAPLVAGTAVCISAALPGLSATQVMDIVLTESLEGLTGFPAGYSTRKLYSNANVSGLIGAVVNPLWQQSTLGNDAWVAFTISFESATITVPDAPTDLEGTPEDEQVVLTWIAPADDGGSAITDYVVQYREV